MIKEKGMISEMITAVRTRLRKKTVTMTTKKMLHINVSARFLTEVRMLSELSMTTLTWTSDGRPDRIRSSSCLTRRVTSTVFLPVCFCRIITRPSLPSPQPCRSTGLYASSTAATSRR